MTETYDKEDLEAHYEALRMWSESLYAISVGVEMLIRGGFAEPSRPWVQVNVTESFIDFFVIPAFVGDLSSSNQAYLKLATSFGRNRYPVELQEVIQQLDERGCWLMARSMTSARGVR